MTLTQFIFTAFAVGFPIGCLLIWWGGKVTPPRIDGGSWRDRFKGWIGLGLLLACIGESQAAYNTVIVSFTNRSYIGSNFVINGNTVRYTNAPLNSTTWIVTNNPANNATNLQRFIGANYPSLYAIVTNGTNVKVSGTDLALGFPGNGAVHFAFTTTNSAPTTNFHAVFIPWDTQPYSTNRTNDADELIYGLNKYTRTNTFSTNAQALTNYVNTGPVPQTFGNKNLTNSTISGGTLATNVITNAIRINTKDFIATNSWILSGTHSNVNLQNVTGLSGIVGSTTNGYGTNWIFNTVTITNLSAPGSGANSVLIGSGGASAGPGQSTVAIGVSATATNDNTTALGTTTLAWGSGGTAIGSGAAVEELSYLGTAVGANAGVTANYGSAFGTSATVTHSNSTAIGYNSTTTTTNQIRIGTASDHVSIPGEIRDVRMTNIIVRGTNNLNGEWAETPRTYSAAIAGYVSALNLGTNSYVRVTGASGALTNASFKGGYSGLVVDVEVVNPGLSCVLLHKSSIGAPAASEMINTGTGALVNMTNNPANFRLRHNGTEWILLWNSR